MTDLSFYRGKKVFITGHTGFKGSWLTQILLQAGATVTGYALPPSTTPSLFTMAQLQSKMHSIIGDIRNFEALRKAFNEAQPEIVFHLAAQPLVRLSYREPVDTFSTNVMGTVNILECLRLGTSVRSFVNVTTDKVYENKEWNWGYRENENLCGHDPYSNSKSCSELVTHSYKNSFFHEDGSSSISTARSGNVIGGGDFSEDRILPDCIKAALNGKEIIIRNPHSTRPYQHVLDCLSGYLLLAEKQLADASCAGAYNFGPDDDCCVTTGKLVDIFCIAWGDASWKVQADNGPHEASFLKLDCAKSKTILGWKPSWDIQTAIEKTVEFAKCRNVNELSSCLENQIFDYFQI